MTEQVELRDGNAAGFRAKEPIDAAIAEIGMRGIIVQGIIASNRRVLGIDHEHSGNGQSGSNSGTNGHAEIGNSNDSYHMREFGTFGVQNNALRRTSEGWPDPGRGK